VRTASGEVVTFTRDEPDVLSSSSSTLVTDSNGFVSIPVSSSPGQPVNVLIQVRAAASEVTLKLTSVWDSTGNPVVPSITNGSANLAHQESIRSVDTSPSTTALVPSPIVIGAAPTTIPLLEQKPSNEAVDNKRSTDDNAEKECPREKMDMECLAEASQLPVTKLRHVLVHHVSGKGQARVSESSKATVP
jgi:hypothetical protein